jgi:predicted secreted hydrolase
MRLSQKFQRKLAGCLSGLLLGASPVAPAVLAAPPRFAPVLPDQPLVFPRDFGAHPEFRTEWWYATGWLKTPDGKPLGFQITFFRSATGQDAANPSRFAPKQLIIAHAALSDPAIGHLLHAQKSAREGFGLAYAKSGNTDIRLDDWSLLRAANGRYTARLRSAEFTLDLSLMPTQAPMLQGEQGYSQKGPRPQQASYYYSEPQLQVSGSVSRNVSSNEAGNEAGTLGRGGKPIAVSGSAWLDHEWSSSVLDENASGWDWAGINLADGSALMAFQIRDKNGAPLWAHAALRDAAGHAVSFGPHQVEFQPQRRWRSPHTGASYPVATTIRTGGTVWQLTPLQDDQELDSRLSTGAVYWEGAVEVQRDGKPAGHGYLEMTGYLRPLKL